MTEPLVFLTDTPESREMYYAMAALTALRAITRQAGAVNADAAHRLRHRRAASRDGPAGTKQIGSR